jgi:hypothetical protein
VIPADTRKVAERLFARVQKLELAVKRLEGKVGTAPVKEG